MGLIDEKRSIYNTIAAYNSMGEIPDLPNPTDSINSINNLSKDPSRFLVDLLVTMIGSTGLVESMGELMTEFIRNAEDDLKVELKKQSVTFNSDVELSTTSFGTSGYDISLSSLDVYEKLKTDPSSDIGNLLYGTDINGFSQSAYNAIVADSGVVNYKNILNLTYNNANDTLKVQPINSGQTIGVFLENYIDSLDLINENEFTSDIVNLLYGTISSQQDKNLQNSIFEEKLTIAIEKLINEFEDLSFSPNELTLIEEAAEEKNLGVDLVDIGCSDRVSNITINQLQDLVDANTGNTNPYGVGLNYISLLGDSFDENDTAAEDNESTIADSFLKKLINAILQNLIRVSSLTPETRVLFAIVDGLKNNGTISIGNPLDDMDLNRNFFDCIVKNAKSMISEYLFNAVKKELTKLVVIVSKLVLKEKYDSYIRIIKSLLGGFKKIADLVT
jgi:hypothetical protein